MLCQLSYTHHRVDGACSTQPSSTEGLKPLSRRISPAKISASALNVQETSAFAARPLGQFRLTPPLYAQFGEGENLRPAASKTIGYQPYSRKLPDNWLTSEEPDRGRPALSHSLFRRRELFRFAQVARAGAGRVRLSATCRRPSSRGA